jgi:5S rRNA maturation endonuclease (ribonuclease M5)
MLDFNDAARLPFEDAEARKRRVEMAIHGNIREFVRYLFPRARLQAQDARVGDLSGAKGESLSISLARDETCGRWIDHATGDRGDCFALYARVHNLDPRREFATVLAECDQWAGGAPAPRAEVRHTVEAARPVEPEPDRVLEAKYVYRDKAGRKVCEVNRWALSNGKKTFAVPGGMPSPRPLYGLDRWHASEAVVIVEGEKCVDALASVGIDATSLMGGANTSVEKTDLTPLAGKTVVLWPDADDPGRKLMAGLEGPLRAIGCTVRVLTVPAGKSEGWDAADAVAEGVDIAAFLMPEADATGRILHELWPDIAFVYEPELVEELFPRVGLGTIYGPSTAGKTFVALDWMAAIATGKPLFGRDTEPVGVLYLAFEGYYGIRKRIHGIKQEKGLSAVALELVDAPWTLSEPQDWAPMRQHINAARGRLKATGYGMGIIIVDTITAAYAGMDANSQAEVTKALRQLKRLAMDTQCLVLVVGHTGKDTTRGMVGSFAYKSESDTFIELRTEKDEGDDAIKRRSIYIEKVKDGRSDFTLSDYALIEVRIGTKPNGKPITTCVVEYVQPVAKATQERQPVYKGAYQDIVNMLAKEQMTTSEVADKLGLDRSNAFKKLRVLEKDGAIFARADGQRSIWVLCNTDLHTSVE